MVDFLELHKKSRWNISKYPFSIIFFPDALKDYWEFFIFHLQRTNYIHFPTRKIAEIENQSIFTVPKGDDSHIKKQQNISL